MRRLFLLLASLLLLTACSGAAENQASSSSAGPTNQSTEGTAMKTIFIGDIAKTTYHQADPSILQLTLKDVLAVADPENIVAAFKSEGVVLNVPVEKLAATPETVTAGRRVTCTLKGLPVMTMSIPPQVPGNSIEKVALLED